MSANNMYWENHGGDCCGRKHIAELGYEGPTQNYTTKLRHILNENIYFLGEPEGEDYNPLVADYCVEITLTEVQAFFLSIIKEGKVLTWDKVLREDFGFKRVHCFKNPNSQNKVYVYLRSETEVDNNIPE